MPPPDGSQGGTRDELLCPPLTGEESGRLSREEHGMSSHVSGGRRVGDRGGRGKNKPLPPQSGGHGMSSYVPSNRGRGNIKPLPLTQGRVHVLVATMNGLILSLLSITGGEA